MILNRHIGTSTPTYISEIIKLILNNTPDKSTKLLDIGMGKGIVGYILRCYFPSKNQLYMVGTDIVIEDLHIPVLEFVYNKIVKEDVRFMKLDEKFDLSVLSHVLEHITIEEAIDVLNKLKNNSAKILLALPSSKKDHIYTNLNDPHSHKWGIDKFPFVKEGFNKIENTIGNYFLWENKLNKNTNNIEDVFE